MNLNRHHRAVFSDFRAGLPGVSLAFTLIELLVVIATIAILASLLLPALSRAKTQAYTAECQNNLHQLMICWTMYAHDNNDTLVPNNSVQLISGNGDAGSLAVSTSWCMATNDTTNIMNGMLYQYNAQTGIYHCPADHSTMSNFYGAGCTIPSARSYNMSQSINGCPSCANSSIVLEIPCFTKLTQIYSPNIANCMVFVDESPATLFDSQFGMPTEAYYLEYVWWDMPADRHDQGANLAFADGHVSRKQWRVPKTFDNYIQGVSAAEMPDWEYMTNCLKQTLN